jgi:molybdopterin/thiamine biosynthesis adenylyltransferase
VAGRAKKRRGGTGKGPTSRRHVAGPAPVPAPVERGRPWYDEDPDRRRDEISSLVAGGYEPRVDTAADAFGVLRVELTLPTSQGRVPAVLVYPDEYPYFKPFVSAAGLGLPHHWSPSTGELCLLARDGDAWDSTRTAATLLDTQWPELLRLNGRQVGAGSAAPPPVTRQADEATLAVAEVPQAEPFTAYLDKSVPLVLVVPGDVVLPSLSTHGLAHVTFPSHRDADVQALATRMYATVQDLPPLRGFVAAIDDEHGHRLWTLADDLCTPQGHEPATATVPWVRIAAPEEATADALWRLVGAHAGTVAGKRLELVLVALPEEASYRETGTGFTVLARGRMSKDGPWRAPGIGQVARAGRRDLLTRAPTLRDAHDTSFLVVGGGGLGSSLGLELARIPPRAICFLDGDAVDPATSLRSPSGWRTAGLSKSHALALLAADCTPYTVIGGTGRRLGAARTNNAAVVPNQWHETWRAILDADVVVDATADFGVHHLLSDMAVHAGKPYVVAEGTRGVFGGLVAAITPAAVHAGEGCWMCLMHHQSDGAGAIPRPLADPAGELVQPAACPDPTYTGTGFDLAVLAAHAARVVVSVLPGGAYGQFTDPVHLATLRDDNGAPMPVRWESYRLPRHPACKKLVHGDPSAPAEAES